MTVKQPGGEESDNTTLWTAAREQSSGGFRNAGTAPEANVRHEGPRGDPIVFLERPSSVVLVLPAERGQAG